ncbi:PAAR domain-containing protein [Paraburkholderia sediminicola]|uniref:PAAR domain-containing protein n=1 Tax=Paraburkholderia metrosideri TaxID=580937 RepID=A0ABW9DU17_9BURK
MQRYLILDGDHTTASGTVHAHPTTMSFSGRHVAHEGDDVVCPGCNTTCKIKCDAPRLMMPGPGGRRTALSDDLCICKCDPPPKLVASQQAMSVDACWSNPTVTETNFRLYGNW